MKRAGGPEAVVTYARRASAPTRAAGRPRACGSPPVGTAREGWFFAGAEDPYALTDDDDDSSDGGDEGGKTPRHSTLGLCVACGTIPACEEKEEKQHETAPTPRRRRRSRVEEEAPVPCEVASTDNSSSSSSVVEEPQPQKQQQHVRQPRKSTPKCATRKKTRSESDDDDDDDEDTGSLSLLECAEQRAHGELLDDLRYTLDGVAHGGAVAARSAARLLEHAAADARGVGLLFRAEDLFAPLVRALAAADARTQLALLGTLLRLLGTDDINGAYVTCDALGVLARAIATLHSPLAAASAPAGSTALLRAESDSAALRTAAQGSPAVRSRARSAFFSCVRSQQQASPSPSPQRVPFLARTVSECSDVDVAEAARDVIAGDAPFAGLGRDAVCGLLWLLLLWLFSEKSRNCCACQVSCGTVALECVLLYCRNKTIPSARDDCRTSGVLAATLDVLEDQLSCRPRLLSYPVCAASFPHLFRFFPLFTSQHAFSAPRVNR